jgi:hypothetical protein
VRTGALDFGRLVCAFHDGPTSYKKLPVAKNRIFAIHDPGGCTTQATRQVSWLSKNSDGCLKTSAKPDMPTRYESGKPMIIADFPTLATS